MADMACTSALVGRSSGVGAGTGRVRLREADEYDPPPLLPLTGGERKPRESTVADVVEDRG